MKTNTKNIDSASKRTVVIISCCLLFLTAASIVAILRPTLSKEGYIANIYQAGILLDSISLNQVTEPYTFTITGENGCENEIEVRPGSIGIRSADCPDKLCVHQGFISDTRLPITCLPNKLVIVLQPIDESHNSSETAPDIITY